MIRYAIFCGISFITLMGTTGCLSSPATPEERSTGLDLVGSSSSKMPIRLGTTTRSQILLLLGEPLRASADGHSVEYVYEPIVEHRGYISFGGPCGFCGEYPWTRKIHEFLWLSFGNNDVLSNFATSRDLPTNDWKHFAATNASQIAPTHE